MTEKDRSSYSNSELDHLVHIVHIVHSRVLYLGTVT